MFEVVAIRDELGKDVPDNQERRVLGQSLLTPCNDFFDNEGHFDR